VQRIVGTASVVFAPTIAWDLAIVQVLWLRLGPLIDTGGRMGTWDHLPGIRPALNSSLGQDRDVIDLA
jgi:hypothetical protein